MQSTVASTAEQASLLFGSNSNYGPSEVVQVVAILVLYEQVNLFFPIVLGHQTFQH
jgi:hypothetical protein